MMKTTTSKVPPAKILSLQEGKKLAYKLIDKWANKSKRDSKVLKKQSYSLS